MVDWNAAAETAVSDVLGEAPGIGSFLSAMVGIFWPASGPDVWSQVQAQVQQVVDAAVAEAAYEAVSDKLTDLGNVLNSPDGYLATIAAGTSSNLQTLYDDAVTAFEDHEADFQSAANAGYRLALLPLFAQYANMYFGLLRDGVLYGAERMNYAPSDVQLKINALQKKIPSYSDYALTVFQKGLADVTSATSSNAHYTEPFNSINAYVRNMTFSVLDYRDMWRFFDPTKYPTPQRRHPSREIYGDPWGTCDDGGSPKIQSWPSQGPSQQPTSIWIYEANQGVYDVQINYPPGGAAGGGTSIGPTANFSVTPSKDVVDGLTSNPVVVAYAEAGSAVSSVKFTRQDGSPTSWFGVGNPSGPVNESGPYQNQVLSSIYNNGRSRYYSIIECIVFGFRHAGAEPDGPVLFGAPFLCQGQQCFLAYDQFNYLSLLQLVDSQDLTKGMKTVYQAAWKHSYAAISPFAVNGTPYFLIGAANGNVVITTPTNATDLSQGTTDVWSASWASGPVCAVPFDVNGDPYFLIGEANGGVFLTTLSDSTNAAKGTRDVWTEAWPSPIAWATAFRVAGSSQWYFLTCLTNGHVAISTFVNPSDVSQGLRELWSSTWNGYQFATAFAAGGAPYFLISQGGTLWITALKDAQDPSQGTHDLWQAPWGKLQFASSFSTDSSGNSALFIGNADRDLFLVTMDSQHPTNGPNVQWSGGLAVSTA